MKDLYTTIIEKLTDSDAVSFFVSKSLPKVAFVDIWKGQYFSSEKFEVNILPAIFFEWSINHRDNTAAITIHIVYEQQRDTSNLSPLQAGALKYFDFIDAINELLSDLESESTSKLELVDEGTIQQDVIETAYTLTYECGYTGKVVDKTCKWDYTGEDNEVEIDGDLVKKID